MPDTARVDVVMPVFNGERHVESAVDSILNQSLDEFRLIVVDDASTDRTSSLLEAKARTDSRLLVHRHESNLGVVGARNTGLALVESPLIAVMDADDISRPYRLQRQAEFLNASPDVGVVGSYVQLMDADGCAGEVRRYPTTPALTSWSLFFFSSLAHPTVMFRRCILEQLRGYSPEAKGGTEDFDLLSRASRVTRLANIPEPLVLYRRWSGSLTQSQFERQEHFADLVVQRSVESLLHCPCSAVLANALRGLSTGRYPADVPQLRSVAHLIEALLDEFLASALILQSERAEVKRDASVRLLLVASLLARRAHPSALGLAVRALQRDPGAAVVFIKKLAAALR